MYHFMGNKKESKKIKRPKLIRKFNSVVVFLIGGGGSAVLKQSC